MDKRLEPTLFADRERMRVGALLDAVRDPARPADLRLEACRGGIAVEDWDACERMDLLAYRQKALESLMKLLDPPAAPGDGDWEYFSGLARAETSAGFFPEAQTWLDLGAERAGWAPTPTGVNFRITAKCNLKCLHCYQEVRTPDGPFDVVRSYKDLLSIPDYLSLFKKSKILRSCGICFSGSETFMRKDAIDLLRGLARQGITLQIGTNGTFPDKLKEALDDPDIRPLVSHVFLSVDGTPLVHDKVRGAGAHELLQRSIAISQAHGIAPGMVATAQEANLDDLETVLSKPGRPHLLVQMRSAAYWQARRKPLAKLMQKRDPDQFYLALDAQVSGHGCRAGLTTCDVEPDGMVLACPVTEVAGVPFDSRMGRLQDFDFDFDALWHSEQAIAVRKKVRSCPGCNNACARH